MDQHSPRGDAGPSPGIAVKGDETCSDSRVWARWIIVPLHSLGNTRRAVVKQDVGGLKGSLVKASAVKILRSLGQIRDEVGFASWCQSPSGTCRCGPAVCRATCLNGNSIKSQASTALSRSSVCPQAFHDKTELVPSLRDLTDTGWS
ncbi:hypothetical protein BD309DRAFT_873938 [Dichomitus squalens]|uniref:Uncharacterized protein n=1 Tax=Dichomitus squalens TaxID=114155 RepID=A0A4Q9NGA1_9APHY|nr:hypothetical protein BD309DRAFT_873938 [Dichomitus squalens]TBU60152.1 hypothetical protein BD310DRAFT_848139 [Dichomitus squalens]